MRDLKSIGIAQIHVELLFPIDAVARAQRGVANDGCKQTVFVAFWLVFDVLRPKKQLCRGATGARNQSETKL